MKVTQIAEILNTINAEIIGESAVVKEDLTNIVDVGREVLGAVDIENYTRSLIDRIGRVVKSVANFQTWKKTRRGN